MPVCCLVLPLFFSLWLDFFFGEHGCFLTTKIVELLVVVMDGFIGLISNQSHIR